MTRRSLRITDFPLVLLMTSGFLSNSPSALAQDSPPKTTEEPVETAQDPDDKAPLSLDELLGLDEDQQKDVPDTEDPLEERRRQALEDRLQERSIEENFSAAITDMSVAANLLTKRLSAGIELQRLQEEIIRRLDVVIEEAQAQQSSSSSSSQQQQQQQQQQQLPNQPQQQQQANSEGEQQERDQGESGETQPPGRQESDLQAIFEESSVEWGSLPSRMRDMIRQGMRESVSRTYRRMTEQYYRKIAEESSE
jgi:hypothetical protein